MASGARFATGQRRSRTLRVKSREMSLAHKVGSDVERAYARSDLLDRRRSLMERWSHFVTGVEARSFADWPMRLRLKVKLERGCVRLPFDDASSAG